MKRFFKVRLLPILLLLTLLCQSVPVTARETVTYYFLGGRRLEESRTYGTVTPDFAVSHLYYDQLENDLQRELYHELFNSTPASDVITITLTDIPEFIIPPGGFTQELENELLDYVESFVSPAYAAASLDNPLLFWTSSVNYGLSLATLGNRVHSITLSCIPESTGNYTAKTYEKAAADLQEVLLALEISPEESPYQQMKEFHDFLCRSVVYVESPNSHNVTGPLLYGQSVCEGYAKAFKLFCDQMEIPCIVITGMGYTNNGSEPHAWNAVRMEDGNWYAVDVTWDDQTSGIFYDFFLVGGESVPQYFQSVSFNQSHVAQGDFYGNGMVILATPALHPTAYDPGNVHIHDYTAEVIPSTCTQEGYTLYTCACGKSYQEDYTPVADHDYTDWVMELPASCHTEGTLVRECMTCGLEDELSLPPADAVYEEVVTPPTCTEQGYTTYYCTTCDVFYVDDYVDPTGHSYESAVTAPTCEENGFTTYTCPCGDSYVADRVPAAGHDYQATVTNPTCTEDGYTTYTCRCGDSYVADETPATGHTFGDWKEVAPGKEERSCAACGEKEIRDKEPVYDIDGNGEVEEADVKNVLSLLVGNSAAETLPDLDFDGKLTIYDCVLLMQQIS